MSIIAERIARGLDAPLFAASAPGDPDRLFILEKNSGRVALLDLGADRLSAQAFYDVPDAEMTNNGERGLLGLAFHPGYALNGRLYLNLTNEVGDTEVWELTRSADPDLADPASRRLVLTVDRDPARSNHNGGWIGFGPDGLLYVATGDGGGPFDPGNNAQDVGDLRGKILRLDVDRSNPQPEIFAYGLRNPWRASFDSETGDLYIADVGQRMREEINFLPAGSGAGTNFGWRVLEGTLPTGLGTPDSGMRAPILEYNHGFGDFEGNVVVGGYVYRGPGGLQGQYFFADAASNHIWTMRVQDGQAFDFRLRDHEIEVRGGGQLDRIVSFGVDGDGRLYAIGIDGEIWRLHMSEEPSAQPQEHDSFLEELGEAIAGLAEAPVRLAESLSDLF
jgi:glucose/arabinose dehydrogenase